MADAIEAFLAQHQQGEEPHIPPRHSTCCCGNDACPYLKHNQAALDGLERDVSTAARLGQALLMRHEAYIADSENERKDMAAQIESLAADKQSLERRNADFVEENRSLLNQLEALNTAVTESDAHVANLQATLTSTQQEMQRLAQLASRTESLERQLAEFEQEQAIWQSKMEEKELSERSALRRWQTAERTLAQIQDQIEQIEREAKEERERHAEIVGRMERRRVVEQELGSAAGRLKSAAALKNADRDATNDGVVSHFVKDILQDNANLQTGIVELREMLNNSNEEVENLRNQLLLHQPTDESEDVPLPSAERKDLGLEMNRAKSQELHVHHHYHAPPAAPKAPPLRRPKKKRYSVYSTGQYTPSSGTSTPRSSVSYNTPNSAAAILQQTAASVPPSAGGKRWSMQSAATYHSILASPGPSSPSNRTSSVYERVFSDFGQDSSRPTTPDTDEPGSPLLAPMHSRKNSASWSRTYSAPVALRHGFKSSAAIPSLDSIMSMEELPKIAPPPTQEDPIPEESERDDDNNEPEWQEDEDSSAEEPHSNTPPPISTIAIHHQPFQPSLRRAASHESLLSVSGMDIHTLKSRPSQLLAPYANRALTSQAVISDTTAHATRPVPLTSRSSTAATGRSLLSGMASEQRQQAAAVLSRPAAAAGLGKKVGGWVFGRWGATPAPSTTAATTTMKTGGEVRPVGAAAVKGKATDVSGTNAAASSKTRATSADVRSVSITTAAKGKADVGGAGTAAAVPKGKAMRVVSDGAIAAGEKSAPTMPKIPKVRSPGINQSGPLLGFFEEVRTLPAAPVLKSLDEEALRDVLGE